MPWDVLPDDSVIERTAKALTANGIHAIVVKDGQAACEEVLKLLPHGAAVHTATSATLEAIGLAHAIESSDKYDSIRRKIIAIPEAERRTLARKVTNTADYAVGSVHAVTQDGHVLVASGSGSQLAPYANSAQHVIWVVGAQKIVANIEQGLKRIAEHSLKLEDERIKKRGGTGTSLNKVLIVNKEGTPGRATIVLVKEALGF